MTSTLQHLPDPRPARSRAPLARRALLGRIPDWVLVLALYGAARVLTTATFLIEFTFRHPVGFDPSDAPQDVFDRLTVWDGRYFVQIATEGYPTTLPVDGDGAVIQNAWAFLPVFPLLVRLLASGGVDPEVVAVLVASVSGAGASIALMALLRPHVGRVTALWSTAFFVFGPMAWVMQIAYAESLGLLLGFAALIAMQQRRYWLLLPITTVLAFTRPGALAIPLALAVHGVIRLVQRDPVPLRERIAIVVTGLVTAAAGLAWPVIADRVTGVPGAYLQTELAWWRLHHDVDHFTPFTPWFRQAHLLGGAVGIGALVVVLIGSGAWLASRSVRRIGSVPWLGTASYLLYLVAAFLPQQSTLRILMPAAPLLGAGILHRSQTRRWLVLSACLVLQPVAILGLYLTVNP